MLFHLSKKLYNPDQIIIFGLYAKNCAREGSDIDIILVSDAFLNIPFVLRMTDILLKVRFPIHVDYICYTREEFARIKNTSTIIRDALGGPVIAL